MKMKITVKDREQSGSYYDKDGCLIATMLKRRGVRRFCLGHVTLHTPQGYFNVNGYEVFRLHYGANGERVKKSAIGKTIELIPR